MKSLVAAITAASAMILENGTLGWALLVIALVLIVVVVVPAVHSADDSKRNAALEVLRTLLGRPRG